MFDLLDRPALGELTDAALIDTLEHHTRAEATEAAARLATIAEIVARHCDDEDELSAHCAIDGWETANAAVSAACNLSRRAASAQMRIAQALRDRLPKVAAVFARGDISEKIISTITWHTQLVTDEDALGLIDTALAGAATTYGALSSTKAQQAIDVWVEKFDPAAVRKTRTAARDRDIHFGDPDDPNGTVSIWGRLLATDAALIKTLLNTMAHSVCDNDPRTLGQRRSDALGALGAGADHLTCQCGNPDCDATGIDPRSRAVVIHLLAQLLPQTVHADEGDSAGEEGDSVAQTNDESQDNASDLADNPDALADPAQSPRDPRIHGESDYKDLADDRKPAVTGPPAIILGGGIVPAPLLAELIATGATIKPLSDPTDLTTETRYRPSTKLAAFVQMRDLVCMFPGCGVSATNCDLDHSTPWPAGATHPGNLGPKCRTHHLLKTFHTGENGWTDIQHPDGSHTWTAPTGQIYHTTPFSQILFPDSTTHTPAPPTQPTPTTPTDRHTKMPLRKRTRQQTRTQRINTERRLNAELDKPPPY